MCNNSPAESTSPENGWRWSVGPIPNRRGKLCKEAASSRRVAVVSIEDAGVRPVGAATGADLGGSSKYSSENLED